MSETRNVVRDTVTDRLYATADQIVNLSSGRTFSAEIEEVQDIELITELGRDAREKIILHVLDRAAASDLKLGMKVGFAMDGVNCVFQILSSKDNPGGVMTDFECARIADGDS